MSGKASDQQWPWWPLLPLYPYGRRRTLFRELIANQVWSFEQLQGLYYVAVPVRLTAVKVSEGLMLLNPLPPTKELLSSLRTLEEKYGPVVTIVLPTSSGLEHKISMPALSRSFPKAQLWVAPGQWSFPLRLPSTFLGIPNWRTKTLGEDGFPHAETCDWIPLGPLDLGLGRFQEIACFHKPSQAILVTDSLVGIEAKPPELFDFDPTPLLFHARERGDEPLQDSPVARKKGWSRIVLFASFLRPAKLAIPSLIDVFRNAFKPGLLNARSHFGLYPFRWEEGWEKSASELIGETKPRLQIAPVLERLVFPRARQTFLDWLDDLIALRGLRWLISAHHSAPIPFNQRDCRTLKRRISSDLWANGKGDFQFLDGLDKTLIKSGVVPQDPLKEFKD